MSFSPRLAACLFVSVAATTSLSAQNPNSGPTTTGQTLTVEVTTSGDVISEGASDYLVSACADLSPSTAVNVVYVIDVSGSMVNPDTATGGNPPSDLLPPAGIGPEDDLNGDGLEGTTLDAAILAVIQLNGSFADLPDVDIATVAFGNGALTGDLSPFAGQTDFISPPLLDDSANGIPDLEDVVTSLQTMNAAPGVAGFELFTNNTTVDMANRTNYDAALSELNDVLASQPAADDTIVFFITDGAPTTFTTGPGSPLQDTIDAGYVVNTYGVGSGAVGLCAPGADLDIIASSTGGTCEEVLDPADLSGSLPGGSATDITELSILVNGAIVHTTLGPAGDMLCTGDVDVLAFLVPGDNVIAAKATTDDGSMVTATADPINKTLCMLFLGFQQTDTLIGPGDTLLTAPQVVWNVTMETCPDLSIPVNTSLIGFHVYLQVGMYNEAVFAADPLQLSNGVDVEIGGSSTSYGSNHDIALWLNQPTPLGGVIDPSFVIHGM
ncbi:MAG: hypothetical protein DRQ55_08905 [Planctomycetota bacterium]|nr:MAG: hypothetical protein DRQ55_08905 [Planctomycetota bacterium]